MIALRVRSVTIVVRSGIFLANALVSRTVFATSKFLYIAGFSKSITLWNPVSHHLSCANLRTGANNPVTSWPLALRAKLRNCMLQFTNADVQKSSSCIGVYGWVCF